MTRTTNRWSARTRVTIAGAAVTLMTAGVLVGAPAHADEPWHDGWCKKGEGFAVVVSLNKLPRPKYYVGAFASIPSDRTYIVRCIKGGVPGSNLGADAALRAAGFSVQGGGAYIAGIEGVGDPGGGAGIKVRSGGWMRGEGTVPEGKSTGSWNGNWQTSSFPIDGFQFFSAVGNGASPEVPPQFASSESPSPSGTGPGPGPGTGPGTAPGTNPGPTGSSGSPSQTATASASPSDTPTESPSGSPTSSPSDTPTESPSDTPTKQSSNTPVDQQNPPDNQPPAPKPPEDLHPGQAPDQSAPQSADQQPADQRNSAPGLPPANAPASSAAGVASSQSASASGSPSASATPTPTDSASPTADSTSSSTPEGSVVFGQDKPEEHSAPATPAHGVPWPVWLVLALLAVGGLGWWFFLLAKRRRKDEDEVQDEVQ